METRKPSKEYMKTGIKTEWQPEKEELINAHPHLLLYAGHEGVQRVLVRV